MNSMKKALALLMVLASLLACTACGTKESPQPQEPDTQTAIETPQEPEEPEFDPYSQEFSVKSDSGVLQLGDQTGTFPWESGLEQQEIHYSSMDGFNLFDIRCTDGTVLHGLREEGAETEDNGLLTSVKTSNPDFATYRGASVGMTQEEVLALYPEAEAFEPTEPVPGGEEYEFSGEQYGMTSMEFSFRDGVLTEIRMQNLTC